MSYNYARPLCTAEHVRSFIFDVLDYQGEESTQLEAGIAAGEAALITAKDYSSTLVGKQHRVGHWIEDKERWQLRRKIVTELFSCSRLDNEELIKLGNGGALPVSPIQQNKELYIIIGLPASGKSGIANLIADHYGAVILDCDYAKRKFEEYSAYPHAGASMVHEESDAIVFGNSNIPSDFSCLSDLCIKAGYNICIPKIGHNHEVIIKIAQAFKNIEYKVHLVLVSLDRRKATLRAINRFLETKRYVPLGLIFDGYSNDPTLTYYRSKEHNNKRERLFESFCKISTDVNKGEKPMVIDFTENSPVVKLFR